MGAWKLLSRLIDRPLSAPRPTQNIRSDSAAQDLSGLHETEQRHDRKIYCDTRVSG